jgi:hypothetical protein
MATSDGRRPRAAQLPVPRDHLSPSQSHHAPERKPRTVTQLSGTLKWTDGEGAHEEHLDLSIR